MHFYQRKVGIYWLKGRCFIARRLEVNNNISKLINISIPFFDTFEDYDNRLQYFKSRFPIIEKIV